MELVVTKRFIGKEENKELAPGEKIVTADVDRINALVGRGYCVISSIEDPKEEKPKKEDPKDQKKGDKK